MAKLLLHDTNFDGKKVIAHNGKIPLQVAYEIQPDDIFTPDGPDTVPLAKIGSIEFRSSDESTIAIGKGARKDAGATNRGVGRSGTNNIAIGANAQAVLDNHSMRNIAIGSNAAAVQTTGTWNVVIGTDALSKSPFGHENVIIGDQAASEVVSSIVTIPGSPVNVDFEANTVIGYRAMQKATGFYNVVVGRDALNGWQGPSSNVNANVVIGRGAMNSVGTGPGNTEDNVAIGQFAAAGLDRASKGVYIGKSAGISQKTGDENTVVGTFAMNIQTRGGKNVAIGAYAQSVFDMNHSIITHAPGMTDPLNADPATNAVYGSFVVEADTSYYIGPFTDLSMGESLKVPGTTYWMDYDSTYISDTTDGFGMTPGETSYVRLAAGAPPGTIPAIYKSQVPGELENATAVGYSTTAAAPLSAALGAWATVERKDGRAIQLGANVLGGGAQQGQGVIAPFKLGVGNSGYGTAGQQLTVNAVGDGVEWAAAASSKRWKTDIAPLGADEAQAAFDAIEAVEFTFTDEAPSSLLRGTAHVGFLAEDVADAGLYVERDEQGPTNISDRDMIAVLWRVVKDQQERISALETALGGNQ
jgi:hypothetical protein